MELMSTKCRKHSAITVTAIIIFLFTVSRVSDRFQNVIPHAGTISPESQLHWNGRSSINLGLQYKSARELIDSVKVATQRVSGTSESTNINETVAAEQHELQEWNYRNPCLSRLELTPMYDARKYALNLPANPLWEELLVEYSKLHRTCMRKVGNLTDYFLSGNASTGCQFVVADVAPWTGLGNKLVVTISSVLYAVLTRRVLLVPSGTLVPEITCEPFLGSSWVLDPKIFPVPRKFKNADFKDSLWTLNMDFFNQIDDDIEGMNRGLLASLTRSLIASEKPLQNAVGVLSQEWQPFNRFYCSAEQTYYSQATWVYLSGCIYTIPKIFATPLFRPILEDLFPDKMVATRLLRSVVLPSDDVWGRVRRINHAYLKGADRRVGIQVRYKDGEDHYKKMSDVVNKRVMDCTHRHEILPEVNSSSHGDPFLKTQNDSSPSPVVKVFVTSLFPGLLEHLSKTFVRYPTLTGEEVSLVQISQDKNQVLDNIEEDQEAFTEVLLLSFSDQLLVTPVSTFGYLAQAYGALTPWFIEMRSDKNLKPCEKAQTIDMCNQFTDKVSRCPHDREVNEKKFSDVVPYIKDCLPIDHPEGIQLITDFQS